MLSINDRVVNKKINTTSKDSHRNGAVEKPIILIIKRNSPKISINISFSDNENLGMTGNLNIFIYRTAYLAKN